MEKNQTNKSPTPKNIIRQFQTYRKNQTNNYKKKHPSQTVPVAVAEEL